MVEVVIPLAAESGVGFHVDPGPSQSIVMITLTPIVERLVRSHGPTSKGVEVFRKLTLLVACTTLALTAAMPAAASHDKSNCMQAVAQAKKSFHAMQKAQKQEFNASQKAAKRAFQAQQRADKAAFEARQPAPTEAERQAFEAQQKAAKEAFKQQQRAQRKAFKQSQKTAKQNFKQSQKAAKRACKTHP